MIAHEANRTQRKISLTEDVAKALIGSVTYGNIGQLKSEYPVSVRTRISKSYAILPKYRLRLMI